MNKKEAKKTPRPMPTDPADLARAMFAVADKKIDTGKRKGEKRKNPSTGS